MTTEISKIAGTNVTIFDEEPAPVPDPEKPDPSSPYQLCSETLRDIFDCQNGGTCYSDSNGKAWCSCVGEYIGYDCNIDTKLVPLPDNSLDCDIVLSLLKKCANGGRCFVNMTNPASPLVPKCVCPEPLGGEECYFNKDHIFETNSPPDPNYINFIFAVGGSVIFLTIVFLAVAYNIWLKLRHKPLESSRSSIAEKNRDDSPLGVA